MRPLLLLTALAGLATPAPRASAQNLAFANARYASHSSLTLYAGYDAGPALVFVGVLHNPRSAFQEALVGVARPFGGARRSVLLGTALATANDGALGQVYILPNVSVGALTLDATAAFQKPLDGGPLELSVSPANALLEVGDRWQVGATWVLSATFGREHKQALGPALVRRFPGAAVGLHVLRGFQDRPDEVWLTARVTR